MINVRRLMHTFLPFMVMNMVQRVLLLLLQPHAETLFIRETVSLAAFLLSSAAAVFMFRQKTYTDDSSSDTPPLVRLPVGLCVMLTVVCTAVMTSVMYALSFLAGRADGTGEAAQFTLLGIVSAVVLHPILEELIFRKMFYGELRLMNPIFGCLAQALMFSILHSTVDGMIYALAGGVVLAVLYELTGRIEFSAAAHALINLRSVLCMTVFSDKPALIHGLDFVLIAAGIICFAGCTTLSVRRKNTGSEEEKSE